MAGPVRLSVFAYAFRPLFLLVGLAGLFLIPLWVGIYFRHLPLAWPIPPSLWHAHEMLFGLVSAAIAGFLLTSVPSSTRRKGFAGWPLVIISALWLAARLLLLSPERGLAMAGAVLDLAFLPFLIALIAPALIRENNRNTPLLAVVIFLWLCNLAFYGAIATGHPNLASRTLVLTIDAVMVLVTVIGGRIVPSFTRTALRPAGKTDLVRTIPRLGAVAITAMVVVAIGDLWVPDSLLAGGLAAVAAIIQALRLLQWASLRILHQPMVWVLHVAYAWIPVALLLKAFSLLAGGPPAQYWIHALTIGAFTTMIMAVMTRAALSHTGRPILAYPLTTASYLFLTLAAITRVFGPMALGLRFNVAIVASSIFWTAAFALYMAVHVPILSQARADGRPG